MAHKILSFLLFVLFATTSWGASLINDTETERLLNELVAPLAQAAEIPDNRLRVHIINDNDFNAFVRGGEDVYVYTGLLTQIKTPAALQAVIAHELGHTLGGHMAQMSSRMDAELKRTMLIQALGVGLMVAGGNPSLGAGVLAGSSSVAQQSMLAFSRDEERIADNLGLDLMVRAKLNPNGFIDVFEQMKELTGAAESKINPNRINHPLTTERLKNVRERIAEIASDYSSSANDNVRQSEYDLVRAKLIGYLEPLDRVRNLYPYSDKSDAALYARAIANMRGGNLDGARMGTQTLISRHPSNPYFYELLGDIEYQFGHYDDSVIAYEKSLSLFPDAPQIQTALALVLTERHRPDDTSRAIELCKRSLLSDPAPLTYWVLSRAYGDDDAGRRDWAMAEFYAAQGNSERASEYARRAQKKLKKTDPEYIKSGDLID
ncbi:MAG: M48 family metalloprotease [Alphaproteobacteria bacterium]|nr:M48 family metalloprotease [Alphaproteobacteria bacterium]